MGRLLARKGDDAICVMSDEIITLLITIAFSWRRNTDLEPVLDAQGQPVLVGHPPKPKKQIYPIQHTITVPLDRQKESQRGRNE